MPEVYVYVPLEQLSERLIVSVCLSVSVCLPTRRPDNQKTTTIA